VAAGWRLSSGYVSGGGITVVIASNGYGGMCLPANNYGFVFDDGVFAGTLAPFGTGPDQGPPRVSVDSQRFIMATFAAFQAGDPFCCPSREIDVSYTIDRSSGLPVLQVTSVMMETITYDR
jgi:hypothetical protein